MWKTTKILFCLEHSEWLRHILRVVIFALPLILRASIEEKEPNKW